MSGPLAAIEPPLPPARFDPPGRHIARRPRVARDFAYEALVGRRCYVLLCAFVLEWFAAGAWWRIAFPAGFRFDGASVPRLVWSITGLTPDALGWLGVLPHDAHYAVRGRLPAAAHLRYDPDQATWVEIDARWSRRDADRLFIRFMRRERVPKRRRRLAYCAVRLLGWVAWCLP